MRNRRLHDSLRAFALDAARALSADLEAGAEVAFELDERSTGRSVLYRYRPLIATFISARWQQLRTLESFGAAAEELGAGSAAYLRVQGLAAEPDAEPALLAMLERIWEDATSFAFPEDRFERVYEEVERALYEGVLQSAIAAPLPGLVMERDRVDLGDGMALVRGDLSGAPAEAVWPSGTSEIDRGRVAPNVVALIDTELPADAQLPIPEARWRMRRVVTALRLWRAGSVSLPGTGWARADDGPWRQVALQPAPPARGGAWALGAEEEDGFTQFAALVAAWEPTGPIAWALARFDMGCERSSDGEALSDYLLALRGMLDAVDEAGQPTLARRLAALCAEEANRSWLMSRVDAALNLELALIGGVPIDAWVPPAGVGSGRDLVGEIEEHLRALLRDVVCGYLKPELASMADEILLKSGEVEIRAHDMRTADAPVAVASVDAFADFATHPAAPHAQAAPPQAAPPLAPHPLDPPTTIASPMDPPTEQSLPPEHRSPSHLPPEHSGAPDLPATPHHERHQVREFIRPVALVPPEAEPRITRLIDVINDAPAPATPTPAPTHEQPALVVDDFAWDLDDPGDYSAPV
ncbi:MAG TPA: hypothetical protein VF066_12445 [Thermoleophilaceae bacterium]